MPVERWTFVASGQDQVIRAYESIQRQAAKTESGVSRSFKRQATGAKRAAKQTERAWSAAKRPLNETEKLALKVARTQERAAKKAANAQIRESKRAAAAQIREAKKVAAAQVREAKRVSRARRRTAGAIGGVALRGIGAAGAAGALVLGAAARQSMSLRDQTIRLAIKGGRAGGGAALQRRFENEALATPGARAAGLAGGVERFVAKTGELDVGLKFTRIMAEISVASGTTAEEIGGAMADMYEKFDISSVEDMSKAMAMLYVQGKRGAFELEDAAKQFPKMAAAAQRFGLGGIGGLTTLGGLSQIARRATPSGEEASTAVENMFKQLISKSAMIKRETGARVFEDKGKTVTRDVRDILVETIAGAKGDLQKLQKIFDVRGIRAVSPLISEYNLAYRGAGGTEKQKTTAATEAVRLMLAQSMDAMGAEAEVRRDLAASQQQAGVQLTAAWESLVAEVMGAATPAMGDLAKTISGFVRNTDMGGLSKAFMALVEAAGLAADALGWLMPEKKKDPLAEAKESQREAEAGLEALGLTAEQRKAIAPIGQLANIAELGGGMDPADLASWLKEYKTKVSPEQFATYRKLTAQQAGAKDVLFAGDQTRQQTLNKLIETGMDPKEAIRRVSAVQADPSSAAGAGGIDLPLIGRIPAIGMGLDEPIIGPLGGTSKGQEEILKNFASTLDQAESAAGRAKAEIDKLAKAASEAAEELRKTPGGTVFKLF